MSDSVRPHRRQPTRLPCPWDSPGKNTGVGCHFLLQCMKVKSESEIAQSCPTLSDPMDCSLLVSSVYGIFQARVLEWGAIAFSKAVFKSWAIVGLNQPSVRAMSFGKLLKSNVRIFISYGFLGTVFGQVLNKYTIQVFGFVQMSISNIEKYFYLD